MEESTSRTWASGSIASKARAISSAAALSRVFGSVAAVEFRIEASAVAARHVADRAGALARAFQGPDVRDVDAAVLAEDPGVEGIAAQEGPRRPEDRGRLPEVAPEAGIPGDRRVAGVAAGFVPLREGLVEPAARLAERSGGMAAPDPDRSVADARRDPRQLPVAGVVGREPLRRVEALGVDAPARRRGSHGGVPRGLRLGGASGVDVAVAHVPGHVVLGGLLPPAARPVAREVFEESRRCSPDRRRFPRCAGCARRARPACGRHRRRGARGAASWPGTWFLWKASGWRTRRRGRR